MSNFDIEEKPSVLFTNLFLAARSGSELHVLELAKAFLAKGWDVTCYTLVFAYPLQDLFAQAGIKVIRFGEEELLADHYSVLYAQHHIVSDYLWNCTPVIFDKAVVSSLGPKAEHEKLPSFSKLASLQVFVSYETYECNHIKNPKIPSFIFPNSADKLWFDTAPNERLPKAPKRIAIISNHIAQELLDFKAISDEVCCVDCYGYEGRSVEITPSLITSYDLVISIGRTVPLCFAARIPVYCYDIHGGPGYINPDTIERDSFFNFSGRSNPRKRSASELFNDIVSNYENAASHLDAMRQYAYEHFNFTSNFEKLYRTIIAAKPMPTRTDSTCCAELTKINRRNQCEAFIDSYSKALGTAQLFFSSHGKPTCETNSVTFQYCYHTEIDVSNLIQNHAHNGACIRFDPDIHPVICTLSGEPNSPAPLNFERSTQEGDLFLTCDPIYQGEILELHFRSSPLSEADLCLELNQIKAAKEQMEQSIENKAEQSQTNQGIRGPVGSLLKKMLNMLKTTIMH